MIDTAKTGYEHFAVFPEEIPRMAIKSCCPPNGIVLDPFTDSGTIGKVTMELNRKSIFMDLQSSFVKIIKKHCGEIKIL